jgi:hypothetical protein
MRGMERHADDRQCWSDLNLSVKKALPFFGFPPTNGQRNTSAFLPQHIDSQHDCIVTHAMRRAAQRC